MSRCRRSPTALAFAVVVAISITIVVHLPLKFGIAIIVHKCYTESIVLGQPLTESQQFDESQRIGITVIKRECFGKSKRFSQSVI